MKTRREVIGAAVAGTALGAWPVRAALARTLFSNVLLVDGTGTLPRPADVLIASDRVTRIGAAGTLRDAAARAVDGAGRVLAPGFIDLHTHGDPLTEGYETFLAMGVTTITLGQDGSGPRLAGQTDLRPWLNAAARAPLDVNVATLSSHGTLRRAVGISDATRGPNQRHCGG